MNKKQKIVFDCDGTLIHTKDDSPRKEVINLMRFFNNIGWDIYAHSGGGTSYCEEVVRRLGLDKEMHITIVAKGCSDIEFDIAVDDAIDPLVGEEEGHKIYIHSRIFIRV